MTNEPDKVATDGGELTGSVSAVNPSRQFEELVVPTQYWLRQRIPPGVSVGIPCVRTAAEVRRIGAWLAALETGCLSPTTERQQEFVAMCFGRRAPVTEIEHLWSCYMLRRYSDRQQVCICAEPEEKSCQYETGWNFRGLRICVHCGWALPTCKGKPKGRRWFRAATEALRTANWFLVLSNRLDQLHQRQS
jgi:uncharacterized protein YifE (UPF0438 family)